MHCRSGSKKDPPPVLPQSITELPWPFEGWGTRSMVEAQYMKSFVYWQRRWCPARLLSRVITCGPGFYQHRPKHLQQIAKTTLKCCRKGHSGGVLGHLARRLKCRRKGHSEEVLGHLARRLELVARARSAANDLN